MSEVCNANINVGAAKALSRKGELLAVPTQLANGDVVQVYIRKQDIDKYRDAANFTPGVVGKVQAPAKFDKVEAEELGHQHWNIELHIP